MDAQAGLAGGRHPVVRLGMVLGVLLMVLLDPRGGSAQRLSGRLLDLSTNDPLTAGVLTLQTVDGIPVRTAFTDDEGGWTLEVPGPGLYYLEASRFGYETWVAGPLEVVVGDDLLSVYHLRPMPIRLDPIEVTVEATRRHLELAGFYERQRSDFGYFMGPEQIERRRAPRITDLLMGLPGVRQVSLTSGSTGRRFIQLRGSNLSQGGICRPRVFVDGLLYALGDSHPKPVFEPDNATEIQNELLEVIDQGLSLDDIGPPSDLAAIEIYRSASQVPVQFGGTSVSTLCGVIVIWTKRGTIRPPG